MALASQLPRFANSYLLEHGITGVWFETNRFDYIEAILQLFRNELRYRRAIVSKASADEDRGAVAIDIRKRLVFLEKIKGLFRSSL